MYQVTALSGHPVAPYMPTHSVAAFTPLSKASPLLTYLALALVLLLLVAPLARLVGSVEQV